MAMLGGRPVTLDQLRPAGADRTGIALGLTLTGTGICAVLAPQYGVWLDESFGWRAAYIALHCCPIPDCGADGLSRLPTRERVLLEKHRPWTRGGD